MTPLAPPTDCPPGEAPSPFPAVILAGGQSRRFGRDKALAQCEGESLLSWAARSFPPAAARLLVAPPGKYSLDGWVAVPDRQPGLGPLGGLETALAAAPPGWVAVAGVDNPRLTPAYWERLLAARRAGALAVQAEHPERGPQPLGTLYHSALWPRLGALLAAGERRLRRAVPAPEVVVVTGFGPEFFWNINEPGALPPVTGGR